MSGSSLAQMTRLHGCSVYLGDPACSSAFAAWLLICVPALLLLNEHTANSHVLHRLFSVKCYVTMADLGATSWPLSSTASLISSRFAFVWGFAVQNLVEVLSCNAVFTGKLPAH